jgi:glycosyltransferase involved in cell wall biosynthesis
VTQARVSVVMGVYNGRGDLDRALDSVLGQAGVDLEVVVVDDGSTDGTAELLARRAEGDGRLRVIQQENAGLTRALIRGCAAATGEFIARQDADDVSLPGRLSAQAALLASDRGLSMVSCWSECVGPRDELLFAIRCDLDSAMATRALLAGTHHPSCHGSVMFRRRDYEAVGGYRAAFYYAQDSDLWRRLADRGRLGYVPAVLYRFGMQPGSISRSRRAVQLQFDDLARACLAARQAGQDETPILDRAMKLGSTPPGQVRERGTGAYFIGRCLLDRGDIRARRYLTDALRDSPMSPRIWVALLRSLTLHRGPQEALASTLDRDMPR